jgi:hypothetical protein
MIGPTDRQIIGRWWNVNRKLDEELQGQLTKVLEAGVSDDAMKTIKKAVAGILDDIEGDVMYRLQDDLAPNLTAHVANMAQRAVEQLLEGNEDQMRRYLGCESGHWNGRSDGDNGWGRKREDYEWHSVIHGKLFEQGAVALRKKIVEAHRDLITSERIKDLEDQVKSLVTQVNKANAENEKMSERLRAAA